MWYSAPALTLAPVPWAHSLFSPLMSLWRRYEPLKTEAPSVRFTLSSRSSPCANAET